MEGFGGLSKAFGEPRIPNLSIRLMCPYFLASFPVCFAQLVFVAPEAEVSESQ